MRSCTHMHRARSSGYRLAATSASARLTQRSTRTHIRRIRISTEINKLGRFGRETNDCVYVSRDERKGWRIGNREKIMCIDEKGSLLLHAV